MSVQVAGKQMKRLAGEVMDVIYENSAGEESRRQVWSFFVKNLPHDHTLVELAQECIDAMDDGQELFLHLPFQTDKI